MSAAVPALDKFTRMVKGAARFLAIVCTLIVVSLAFAGWSFLSWFNFEGRPSSNLVVVNKTGLPLTVYQDIGAADRLGPEEQKTMAWNHSNDQLERRVAAVDGERNTVFCRVFTEAALRTGTEPPRV